MERGMSVNCSHHSPGVYIGHGRCGKGLYHGCPSDGVCGLCADREPIPGFKEDVKPSPVVIDPATLAEFARQAIEQFHLLWDELHCRAWTANDLAAEAEWVEQDFAPRVPSAGCTCRRSFAEYRRDHPVEASSRRRLFAWSVALHDAVRAKQNKPPFGLAAAMEHYAKIMGREIPD
jgi:hypothetical protein